MSAGRVRRRPKHAAAARSISLDDIRTVLTKANSNTPVGTLSGADRTVTLARLVCERL